MNLKIIDTLEVLDHGMMMTGTEIGINGIVDVDVALNAVVVVEDKYKFLVI